MTNKIQYILIILVCAFFFNLINYNYSLLSQPTENLQYYSDVKQNYFEIKNEYNNFLKSSNNAIKPRNSWMNRWLWNYRLDINIDGSFKYNELDNSNFVNKIYTSQKDEFLSNYNWIPVGPIDIPVSYDARSCYSMGRINCIAFHPYDSDILFIGTPGGGIWKSENAGKTWFPLTDNLPSLAISHICIDSTNPNIIYASTGDFDTGSFTAWNALGVIKTTDGGASWTITGLIKEKNYRNSLLRKIIINPNNNNEIIVGGKRGIWKSLDAGDNWLYVCDSIVMDVEINPKNPKVLYAAMGQVSGNGSAGVLKSYDFGDTWVALETGMPAKGEISRVDIAISPADTNYLYIIAVKTKTNGLHSFYISKDAGKSWKQTLNPDSSTNILGSWGGDASDRYGQGWYDLVLLTDPIDKKKVYVGGVNIWVSENEGIDWDIASFWIYCFGVSTHADQHFAAYNYNDKYYYWCNDGGIYRTKKIIPGSKDWIIEWIDKYNEDAKPGHPDFKFPTIWENLSSGLAITEFYRMSLCKNTSDVLAGGSQDNSCFYYKKGDWTNYIPNYDGMETMINNDNPDIIYGVWQFGTLCKSYDGGKSLETRLNDTITSVHKEKGNWVTPVAMDPVNPDILYMGFRNLWRSTDGGYNWKIAFILDSLPDKPANANSLSIIKIHHTQSNYISIYKDAYSYYDDSLKKYIRIPGELWITRDGGDNWEKSSVGLPLDSLNIIAIEYDYFNPNRMWAVFYSYYTNVNTFISLDGGRSWSDISKPMPSSILIRTLAYQPKSQKNILYVGTNRGVYYTDDSTDNWIPFGENLPNCIVNELEIQQSTNEIFAATYGRGIWKTNLLPTSVNEEIQKDLQIIAYPNPTKEDIFIKINNLNNTNNKANIRILDIVGKVLYEENFNCNNNQFEKKINHKLESGIYFIDVNIEGMNWKGKIFIIK